MIHAVKKLGLVFVWLAVSCCIAALFGALHNQVSFTLSDEYFTKFKFFQFGLSEFDVAPRILAAYVGILASWWMGLIIGVIVGLPVLILGRIQDIPRVFRQAIFIVLATSIIGALVYDSFVSNYDGYYVPTSVVNIDAFRAAGSMHNGSYLGAAIGVLLAMIWRRIIRRQS